MSDPARWRDMPEPPEGALDLVRSVDAPPPLPPDLRAGVRARVERSAAPPKARWVGPTTLAAAVVIGALVIWRWAAPEETEPAAASLAPDVEATVDEAVRSASAATDREGAATTDRDDIAAGGTQGAATEGVDEDTRRSPGAGATPTAGSAGSGAGQDPGSRGHAQAMPPLVDDDAGGESAPRAQSGASQVEPGWLSINAQPWARVYVDGRPIGSTPILRRAVAPGRHRILLVNGHRQRYDTTVSIESGRQARIVHRFGAPSARRRYDEDEDVPVRAPRLAQPANTTGFGTLVVNTVPWSRVYVDGELVGNTPVRHRLPAGTHGVRIECSNGATREVRVTIRADEQERIIARLDRPPEPARVEPRPTNPF